MSYVWGAGLIYFGLSSDLAWMLAWCLMFVAGVWVREQIKDVVYDILKLYYTGYNALVDTKFQSSLYPSIELLILNNESNKHAKD